MSSPTVVEKARRTLAECGRPQSQVIEDALKHVTINNAIANVNDDVMSMSDYDKEYKKAKLIIEQAMLKIMEECNLFGDDAIFTPTTLGSYSCKEFFDSLANEVATELSSNEPKRKIMTTPRVPTYRFVRSAEYEANKLLDEANQLINK